MRENGKKYEDDEVIRDDESMPEDLEIDAVEEEESVKDKLRSLREKLSTCEEEKMKHLEDLQRTRADFLNSKRRLEDQFQRDKERATDKILMELVTLVDSFDTAMLDKELWNKADERWRVGVEAIYTKLLATLKSNNVTPINPLGELFNPEEHEAVSNATVEDESQVDRVISVLQKGFKRNNTMIRPAIVIVGTK